MKKLWASIGQTSYYLTWPVLYFYLRGTNRSRVVVSSQGSILVVKDWLGNGAWKLPGGGLHNNEAASLGAARELYEETGISIKPKQLTAYGSVVSTSRGLKATLHCFFVKLPKQQDPKPKNREIVHTQWISLTQLLSSERISPDTRQILTKLIGAGAFERRS